MVNKTDLHNLIHKYYLNGLVERVKWNIKKNTLNIDFVDESAQVVGSLKAEEIGIKDVEIGFSDTTRLLKLLAILNGELDVDFISNEDIVEKMTIDDSKFNVKYSLSFIGFVPLVPKVKNYPEIDAEIILNREDIDSLLKAKGAISESDEVSIVSDKNIDGEDIVNFIFGDPNTPHSNKVTFGVRANIINNLDDYKCEIIGDIYEDQNKYTGEYNTIILKNILSVNKNCGEGTIKFSSQGMLHYNFVEDNFSTTYYMTSKENV